MIAILGFVLFVSMSEKYKTGMNYKYNIFYINKLYTLNQGL